MHYEKCLNKPTLGLLLFTTPPDCCLKRGLILDVRLVFHCHVGFPAYFRKEFNLDVSLVSLMCFPLFFREWFSLDVRLVSLMCFPLFFREWFSLDFRLVSLFHVCFPSPVRKRLVLDVRLVSLMRVFLSPYERSLA